MWEKWHTKYIQQSFTMPTPLSLCVCRLGIVNLLLCHSIHPHTHIYDAPNKNTFSTAKFSVLVYGTIDESKFYKHTHTYSMPNSNLQINKTTSEKKKRKKNGFKPKVMKIGTWKKGDNLKLFDITCCVFNVYIYFGIYIFICIYSNMCWISQPK